MPEYQNLTDDELLHLAEERHELRDDARILLDSELSRRKLSAADIQSYRAEYLAAENDDKIRTANRAVGTGWLSRPGIGIRFLGKRNWHRDESGGFEEYDSTRWFVLFWFPLYPIASFTVRRTLSRWLGFVFKSDPQAIRRLPRNWEQILLTWVTASAVLLALRILYLFLVYNPEWVRRVLK